MYHFIYKITNKVNGHYYIGIHSTNNIDDGYMGSGTLMKCALRKYGVDCFEREIIEHLETRQQLFQKEAELVTLGLLKDRNCYNLVLGGGRISKPIYSDKAEQLSFAPKFVKPFDDNYEYKIDLLKPVCVQNPEVLSAFGKAFWDIITGQTILEIITDLYNDATGNRLANKYILLLERLQAFKHNIVIYRYQKTTLVKNS